MGALIRSCAISLANNISSSVAHAAIAARKCIEEAGISPNDIGMLINTGVYRDNNLFEPGVASLIQKEVGINKDYRIEPNFKPSFSFDLMHGAIGPLKALIVANSFFCADKSLDYILIVASETHPSNNYVEGFPYQVMGSAFLLAANPNNEFGIQSFASETTHQLSQPTMGSISPSECKKMGRESLEIKKAGSSKEYLDHLVCCATNFIKDKNLKPNDTFLVSSQHNENFVSSLSSKLGMNNYFCAHTSHSHLKDPFTSSFAMGMIKALDERNKNHFNNILFTGASSGITSTCLHYTLEQKP